VQAVQAGHAAIAATQTFNPNPTRHPHPHLVLCAVADEVALVQAFEGLKAKGVQVLAWHEDDMGNQLTAVATAPLAGAGRKALRKYKLLV
jgi:hypothetical protein